ncbi:hypothetical protein LB505_005075 [Fusarium chuoi]|nr:hypothetical protein LB505_005075 [Fusarium chuoi]
MGESLALMNRTVLGPVAESLNPSGRLQSQDGNSLEESTLSKEAVLAGLISSRGGFEKPDYGENDGAITLKFGKKKPQPGSPLRRNQNQRSPPASASSILKTTLRTTI